MGVPQYEIEWARTKVDWFARQFGKEYRTLASYAALPLILTPDLLHFLRMRFLPDKLPDSKLSYVAEADLLLSDLCKEECAKHKIGVDQRRRLPNRGR